MLAISDPLTGQLQSVSCRAGPELIIATAKQSSMPTHTDDQHHEMPFLLDSADAKRSDVLAAAVLGGFPWEDASAVISNVICFRGAAIRCDTDYDDSIVL